MEGQNAIKHNIKTDLSEQELVDCAGGAYQNGGCQGGLMLNAFRYIQDNGISTLSSYPYYAYQTNCASSSHPRANIRVRQGVSVPASESSLQAAVGKYLI